MIPRPVVRCAIYTRKSSEEGLDQSFNSLDAQHEACAAYVASQRHEGWTLLPARYDDGGLSGGTLQRPGLQRLLADIDAGTVSMVVVYKIDRLTRALADFAKLVERFDARGCSFVSVTQAFNTSSSMGRLTLNVLLSFAQFEREVTAERIRDKIAASKKKGLWMGGTVPLGYDPHPDPQRRELVVNGGDARTVRRIFDLYLQTGCLRQTEIAAGAEGLRSRRQVSGSGRTTGGTPLSRGQIHYLLTNPVYLGKIRHKTQVHDGRHPAILTAACWDAVQSRLLAARARPRRGAAASHGPRSRSDVAPLLGKLRDETGDLLTPTHTTRRGRRYRYYTSNRLISGGTDPTGWRLPAEALEQDVRRGLAAHLHATAERHRVLTTPDATVSQSVSTRVRDLAEALTPDDLTSLIKSLAIGPDQIRVTLCPTNLARRLGLRATDLSADLLSATLPAHTRRRGQETRLVVGPSATCPDPTLRHCLARAHDWAEALRNGEGIGAIAARAGHSEAYIRTRLPLAFLSPRLQSDILAGTQAPHLSVALILREGVPLDWAEQEQRFG